MCTVNRLTMVLGIGEGYRRGVVVEYSVTRVSILKEVVESFYFTFIFCDRQTFVVWYGIVCRKC